MLEKVHNINNMIFNFVAENYGDLRRTALYFAVSNGDRTCAELLLAAGARTDLDPLQCILVAVRAERCVAYLCIPIIVIITYVAVAATSDVSVRPFPGMIWCSSCCPTEQT